MPFARAHASGSISVSVSAVSAARCSGRRSSVRRLVKSAVLSATTFVSKSPSPSSYSAAGVLEEEEEEDGFLGRGKTRKWKSAFGYASKMVSVWRVWE